MNRRMDGSGAISITFYIRLYARIRPFDTITACVGPTNRMTSSTMAGSLGTPAQVFRGGFFLPFEVSSQAIRPCFYCSFRDLHGRRESLSCTVSFLLSGG